MEWCQVAVASSSGSVNRKLTLEIATGYGREESILLLTSTYLYKVYNAQPLVSFFSFMR